MKGLEISEVRFSDLNTEKRFDAEYFKKEYLNEDLKLSNHETSLLGELSFVTDGQHGYYQSDPNSKIHMLAARNCKDFFANLVDAEPLAKWVDDNNKRSSLQNNDIILSTRGSIGCCAIVYDDVLPANINQDVARIKLENTDVIPEFLIVYLNTKYGQNWMIRNQTGMVQQGLPLDKVRQIPIPLLSFEFQQCIEKEVQLSYNKLAISKQLYSEAESLLLSELGLEGWQPKNDNVSIKSFSDFSKTGRLDAEYYQNKYDEIEKKLENYGAVELERLCKIKDMNFNPIENLSYRYIELSNIGNNGEIKGCTVMTGCELPSRARRIVNEGELLISSIEGSSESCAIVSKEYDKALCSTGFYVLTPTQMNVETMLLLFKSAPIQNLMKKGCSGTILTAISKEELQRLKLPNIRKEIQQQISSKIQESFALQSESKRLLEEAKSLVEREIQC